MCKRVHYNMCQTTAFSLALLWASTAQCKVVSRFTDLASGRVLAEDWPGSILLNSKHPYHRVQPVVLCHDPLFGALEEDRLAGPPEDILPNCSWRLGDPHLGGAQSPGTEVHGVPSAGRRWVFHDVFARDGQMFAIMPSYLRVPARLDQLAIDVRIAGRRGEHNLQHHEWHALPDPETVRSSNRNERRINTARILRWVLPREMRSELGSGYLHLRVQYAFETTWLQVWH